MLRPSLVSLVSLVAVVVLAPGCGRRSDTRATLSVFAASSLTESFEELERAFERAHPQLDVQLAFAGSQILRVQLEQGARADVFASANEDHVRALSDIGLVADSEIFAVNALVVVVPLDNPAAIERFEQLPRARRLVIGSPEVPVGAYTRALLERARASLGPSFVDQVRARVVSEESNVRLVRAKVELGEADAAIVYRTDAMASTRVRAIPIPKELGGRTGYRIATLARSDELAAARDFVALVRSPAGQEILARHGFVSPTEAP